jgi:hypothetical protein
LISAPTGRWSNVPELLLQENSPYNTRRASLLRGEGDLYLYLEDLVGPGPATTSAVWVGNVAPAPTDKRAVTPPGVPPRMGAGGTQFPDGCPDLGRSIDIVWFEEGDAVAVVDAEGVLAVIPGWAGRNEFYGYSRYARGRTGLAWELTRDAAKALEGKVRESSEFWRWRRSNGWNEVRTEGLTHLEERAGPQEAAWPLGSARFPELIATRHQVGELPVWVTATTGLSAQRMAGVEQYVDRPEDAARIELALARTVPDQSAAELLSALAVIPFTRCTWLGEGHTIGGAPGRYPAFGAEKAAVLLTAEPPRGNRYPLPDLSGRTVRGEAVTYLWVMVIDEETFRLARGRDARAAIAHLQANGATWVQ